MKNKIGVMQGRLLPKHQGRYQAHPLGYWQKEFEIASIFYDIYHDKFKIKPLDGSIESPIKLTSQHQILCRIAGFEFTQLNVVPAEGLVKLTAFEAVLLQSV